MNKIIENNSGGWTLLGGTVPTGVVWADPVEVNVHNYIAEIPAYFVAIPNSGIYYDTEEYRGLDYLKQQYEEGLRSLYCGNNTWISREAYEDLYTFKYENILEGLGISDDNLEKPVGNIQTDSHSETGSRQHLECSDLPT